MSREVEMLRRLLWSLVLGSMVAVLVPALALAQGRMKLGPVRLLPSLAFNQEFTTNYFLTRSDKESNWIFTQSPQILAILPIDRHSLLLSYKADFTSHSRFDEYNRVDQSLGGLLELNFPGGLGFRLDESFQTTAVPPDFKGDRQLFYGYNLFTAEVSFKRASIWKARLGYANTDLGFDDRRDRIGDYNIDLVDFQFDYNFTAKTAGVIEFIWKGVDNRAALTDNERVEVLFGVSFDPTAKLNGTFKAGLAVIDFKDSVAARPDTQATLNVNGSLTYRASRFDDIRLAALRNFIETSPVAPEAPFGPFFTSTGFTLGWDHRFRGVRGLASSITLGLVQDDFKGGGGGLFADREDDYVEASAALGYSFGWYFKIDWFYMWRQRDSNRDTNDYQEHRSFLRFIVSL
jgi:hypothetical protein